jgi:hypothetical protein
MHGCWRFTSTAVEWAGGVGRHSGVNFNLGVGGVADTVIVSGMPTAYRYPALVNR